MNRETLTGKQGVMLLAMFIIGSASLFIMGLEAGQDVWLAIILAMVAGLLVAAVYARILSILPGRDFFEVLEFFFGKVFSRIILGVLTGFTLHLACLVLENFSEFVVTIGLPETPIYIIAFSIMLLCVFAVKHGVEVMGRWTQIFLVFIILFILTSVILSIPKIEWVHLRPTFYKGMAPIMRGAFSVFAFPFAQTMVFLLALPAFKAGISKYKVFLSGILLGGLAFWLVTCTDILLVGVSYARKVIYPTYEALSVVKGGRLFERLEIIAATVFTTAVFLKIAVLLLAVSKGVSKIVGLRNYRPLVIPTALLIGGITFIAIDNAAGFHKWGFEVYPTYSSLFQWIIPIFIWIFIEIRYWILNRRRNLSILHSNREA